MSLAIRVENLSKRYRLGLTHAGSIRELVNRTVSRLKGKKEERLPHELANAHANGRQVEPDGSFWALKDVSFEVQKGDVLGIIGRNGAGKSTLLKILSRVTAPTQGRVELYGRVASLLEVGTGFHPELTGRENVFLNGAILGMTRAEVKRKFDEIVAFAEIDRFIDTPVKRYSSGMYVRLAFAVAAHLDPEILIVDEVLAVGDADFQKKCLGKMGDVSRSGRTIIFVSHNMAAVQQLCLRAILLRNGIMDLDGGAPFAINAYLRRDHVGSAFTVTEASSPNECWIASARIARPQSANLVYGDPLEVEVTYCSRHRRTLSVEIIIRDQSQHPIVFLPSGLRFGKKFKGEAMEPVTVRCTIPVLPLAEGEYFLDILVADTGLGVLDRHECALSFKILSSDPCGTKRSFSQATRQGCVHLDANFVVA